jgi:predicted DNA-binding transcriptional regulator YafY
MDKENHTLLRQWKMLRHIPKYPQKKTSKDLQEKLELDLYIVSKRTIERDLERLSTIFPIACDSRNKPYGWSWDKNAPAFDIAGLDQYEAIALLMLEQYLGDLLPSSTLDALTPYFRASHQYLGAISKEKKISSWTQKVRSVTANQPLIPPKIDKKIQRAVSEALLNDNQMKVIYQKPGNVEKTIHQIHPLAMVERGGIIYLVVKIEEYQSIRTLALHRIEEAEILNESVMAPDNFNIDEEIRNGLFGFGANDRIQFKGRFSTIIGARLMETPLSSSQVATQESDGKYLIEAEIPDTPQLLWWLLSLNTDVEVLKPESLREKVTKKLKDALDSYR